MNLTKRSLIAGAIAAVAVGVPSAAEAAEANTEVHFWLNISLRNNFDFSKRGVCLGINRNNEIHISKEMLRDLEACYNCDIIKLASEIQRQYQGKFALNPVIHFRESGNFIRLTGPGLNEQIGRIYRLTIRD